MPKLAQGVYGKTVQFRFDQLLIIGSQFILKMVWFQFGRVFPSLNFSVPFLHRFLPLLWPLSHVFIHPSSPPFSGSGSPSWNSNYYIVGKRGSRVSLNGSGKSATIVILLDRVPALWGMGIGSVYVPGWYTLLAGTRLWSAHVCRGLIISVLLVPLGWGDPPWRGDNGMAKLVLLFI